MILVYTGSGKGKTSACLGQALRALGHGYTIAFCQCIKRDGRAGEQKILHELLGENFFANGIGFVHTAKNKDVACHKKTVAELLRFAQEKIPTLWMLILDEILYALAYELVSENDLRLLFEHANYHNCHLVLSGRYCPDWIKNMADYVSEIVSIAHPFFLNQKSVLGIDY